MPFYFSMGRRRSSLSNLSSNNSPYRYVSPDGNNVWKGPRKICCFCTLAIVFPALLISVPLLMRFVLYGSSLHYLSASDMKMVDQRISTIWCQAETVRINTSFTVYVTEGEPSVVETPTPLSVERNLIIPADHKEYWGFYLLKGSRFKIRTCARWKGGTLLIVQGRNNLERCAYLGEADSAGDSDQVSSSSSAELLNKVLSHSQEEMTGLLTRIRQYIKSNPKNYGRLKKNLSNWLLVEDDAKNNNGETNDGNQHTPDMSTDSPIDMLRTLIELESSNSSVARFGNHSGEELLNAILGPSPINGTQKPPSTTNLGTSLELLANTMEVGTIRRNRRQVAEIRKKTESGENGAFEDESRDDEDDGFEIMESVHPRMKYLTSPKPHTPSSIWEGKDGHHRGVLNDTFDPNDGSNSESESSFSSSEEAVQNCEGVLASLNINFDENCEAERSFEELELSPNDALYQQSSIGIVYTLPYYEDIVNVSGYYYFVFGSENEKRDNFIRGRFDLEKLEYELPEPLQNCTNVKECHIPFEFASSQKVVVKIPQPPPHADDAWDRVYVAETECHPRTHLYMIFALLVPLVILLCAFQ